MMSRILIQDENGPVLAEQVIIARSLKDRMRGLLGRSSLAPGTAMLLTPCRSIHMWFMRFPIDAVFLDRELRVLKIVHNLKPWQLAFAPPKTHAVLETAAHQTTHLQPGHQLLLR